ncbi:YTH domain-containing family protein isoform X3 [Bradysia coprophila]|uniref:YTH domain-containing family protein isoform X3 n=1 Tax=Bradysia coprophila TaxID=38358 RepID=UPI00187D7065|nr:YTH domain-containing family protein isoform X3 [Bradysia coprophila]
MSAGVSDQRMKGQGNQDSNVPKGPVQTVESESWNDQIASHAAQVSAEQYNSGNHSSNNGAQFQYPPFSTDNGAWSSGNENVPILSGYSIYDNYAGEGMFGPSFGQQSSYNYFPNNGDYNTWGSQQINSASSGGQSRKGQYDEYYRGHGSYQQGGQDGIKSVEQGMQGLNIDMGQSQERDRANTEQPKETAPKQMTWASIASQPAKPQIRTSSSSSILKKKGPGMPPPPMVPGKHNMDIGTWDSPKNGPPLVPPPVPVITAPPPIEPSPLSQQKSNIGASAGPLPGQSQSMPMSANGPQQHNQHNAQQQQQHHQQQMSGPQRPAWSGGNRAPHPGMMAPAQPQRQNMSQTHGPPSMMGFQGQSHHPPQHHQQPHQPMMNHPPQQHSQMAPPMPLNNNSNMFTPSDVGGSSGSLDDPVLEELRDKNEYNPQDFDYDSCALARFFVIKSYSEDDIHRSIKYEIWCSTEHGNKRLDQAYREREKAGGIIYLLFSVNSSAHFCGMAQMMTAVDYNTVSNVWSQDKWKGTFKVKWIFVKDVPMREFKSIRLENNEDKPVTNSRDTQEVPNAKGIQFLHILSAYKHSTSIFDDFIHYEQRQKAEDTKKVEPPPMPHYDRGPNKPYHDNGGGRGYDRGGYDRGGKSYGGQYNNHGNRSGGYHDYNRGFDRNRDHNDGGYNRDGRDNRDNRDNDGYQRRNDYVRRSDDRGGFMHRDRDNNDGVGYVSRDSRGGGHRGPW